MTGSSADLELVQRTAEQVLEPAFQWIQGNQQSAISNQQFFAWVHLYDPHEPYAPPEPYRSRYSTDPYAGEVAYTDASLGAFLDRLSAGGLLSNALVVVAADHGESLGEHGERTHGLFAYDATLRVPLVLWAPQKLRPAVVTSPARLVDIAPTILDLVGAAPLQQVDGRSMRQAIAGTPLDDPGSYFEALNANLTRNWAPLRGIVSGGLKLIDLPMPELYDLSADPGELQNLYAQQRERARPLEASLDRVTAAAATASAARPTVDPDAEARLRALGYIATSSSGAPKPSRTYTAADDPKQLVQLNAALDEAAAMLSRGDAASAIPLLQRVINTRPDLTIAYDRLAFILRTTGHAGDAVAVLDGAARNGHADRSLLRSLGSSLRDAGDLRRSAVVLDELVRTDPADLQAADALGQTYARMGKAADAEALFRRVLERSPSASTTWNNLGTLYLVQNRTMDAIEALSRAVTINPTLATAHNGLGVAYARAGQTDRAVEEWKKAIELRPGYPDAIENLQRVQR
jgi:Flp pilus assembly protein TadD